MEPDEFERVLAQARRTLESMRRGGPADEGEPVEGVGEAAEGRVKVTAVSGGRLTNVEINPRAMRLSPEELGGHLTAAANAALKDLRGKLADAAGDTVDAGALARRVDEIQTEGLRQLNEFNTAINEVLGKIRGG
ncbi:YbaB/EbfC family nucleoid-associated protein [Actinomadura chibensis]|uniref:YbaB/EbfC family nucleoid-associated protein n=1 Tax=Actinomadura chibensis TaxID=392828 RepID=UPI000ACAC16D|nr:YbaB/EbfC family nucleoid-associated protein [Actinomadura chibensis]